MECASLRSDPPGSEVFSVYRATILETNKLPRSARYVGLPLDCLPRFYS